jgi:hypothetical protein
MSVLSGWNAVSQLKKESDARKKEYEEKKANGTLGTGFKMKPFPLIVKEGSDKYPDNADVTFVDSSPIILPLVTYKTLEGKYVTRRYQGQKDPINKVKGVKPRQTCLFTIIDHTKRQYTNKEKAVVDVPYTVRYLGLSVDQAESLQTVLRRSKKNLTECVVNVFKSGTQLNFVCQERDEETHILPEELEPIDFQELFPLDVEAEVAGEQDQREESKF